MSEISHHAYFSGFLRRWHRVPAWRHRLSVNVSPNAKIGVFRLISQVVRVMLRAFLLGPSGSVGIQARQRTFTGDRECCGRRNCDADYHSSYSESRSPVKARCYPVPYAFTDFLLISLHAVCVSPRLAYNQRLPVGVRTQSPVRRSACLRHLCTRNRKWLIDYAGHL